jgi:hypothetical protein
VEFDERVIANLPTEEGLLLKKIVYTMPMDGVFFDPIIKTNPPSIEKLLFPNRTAALMSMRHRRTRHSD